MIIDPGSNDDVDCGSSDYTDNLNIVLMIVRMMIMMKVI